MYVAPFIHTLFEIIAFEMGWRPIHRGAYSVSISINRGNICLLGTKSKEARLYSCWEIQSIEGTFVY